MNDREAFAEYIATVVAPPAGANDNAAQVDRGQQQEQQASQAPESGSSNKLYEYATGRSLTESLARAKEAEMEFDKADQARRDLENKLARYAEEGRTRPKEFDDRSREAADNRYYSALAKAASEHNMDPFSYAQQRGYDRTEEAVKRAQQLYDDAVENEQHIQAQIDELGRKTAEGYDFVTGANTVDNSATIEALNKQLDAAQAATAERKNQLDAAQKEKTGQDRMHWYFSEYQNGNKDIYGASKQAVQQLTDELNQIESALSNADADRMANSYNANYQPVEVSALEQRRDEIIRELEEASGRSDVAFNMLTMEPDAAASAARGKAFVEQSDAENRKIAQEKYDANMRNQETVANLGGPDSADYADYMQTQKTILGDALDVSYKRPTEQWTQDQIQRFYVLVDKYGLKEASDYAAEVNRAYNEQAANEKLEPWREAGRGTSVKDAKGVNKLFAALSNAHTGAVTLGANVLATPFHLLSYADKVLTTLRQEGYYTGRANPWFTDYINAQTQGRVEGLNEYGVLPDSAGFLGGKGFGDMYQLVISAAQSAALGNMTGEAATLLAFFGQAADSSFDQAIRMGMPTDQAMLYSFTSGCAEIVGEKFSLEALLKGPSGDSVKELLRYTFKQSLTEGSEEAFTNIINAFGDMVSAELTNNRSEIESKVDALVAQGMSRKDAESQVLKEFLSETAFDALGGFFSGALGGGMQISKNALYEHHQSRGEQKAYKEVRAAGESGDYSGWDSARLAQAYRGAVAANDSDTKAAILSELTNRQEAMLKEEKGKDYGVDRQRLANAIQAQLENAANREGSRPGEYDEAYTPPASEMREEERAPHPAVTADQEAAMQQSEAQFPAVSDQPAQQPVPTQQKQNPLANSWSQQNNIYTVSDLYEKNSGNAKTVADWKTIIQDAFANSSDMADQILDDSATLGFDKRSTFVKAIKQVRAELSTNSTESGTIKASNDALAASAKEANNGGESVVQQRTESTALVPKSNKWIDRLRLNQSRRGENALAVRSDNQIESGEANGEDIGSSAHDVWKTAPDGSKRQAVKAETPIFSLFDEAYKNVSYEYENAPEDESGNRDENFGNGEIVFTEGTDVIREPVKGTDAYDIMEAAKSLGMDGDVFVLSNPTGHPVGLHTPFDYIETNFFDGAPAFTVRGKIFILCGSDGNVYIDGKNYDEKIRAGKEIFLHESFHQRTHFLFENLFGKRAFHNFSKAYWQIAEKVFSKAGYSSESLSEICDKYLESGYKEVYSKQGLLDAFETLSKGDADAYNSLVRGMVCDEILSDIFGNANTNHEGSFSSEIIPRSIRAELRIALFDTLTSDANNGIFTQDELNSISSDWQKKNGAKNKKILELLKSVRENTALPDSVKAEILDRISRVFGEENTVEKSDLSYDEQKNRRLERENRIKSALKEIKANRRDVNKRPEGLTYTDQFDTANTRPAYMLEHYGIDSDEFVDYFSNASLAELVVLEEYTNILAGTENDKYIFANEILRKAINENASPKQRAAIYSKELEYMREHGGMPKNQAHLAHQNFDDYQGEFDSEVFYSTMVDRAASYEERRVADEKEAKSTWYDEELYGPWEDYIAELDEVDSENIENEDLWENSEPLDFFAENDDSKFDFDSPVFYLTGGKKSQNGILTSAILLAANGDVKNLSDQELRDVLEYALDRASPETKGDPLADRAADLILSSADETGRNARPQNWLYDSGYSGNTVGSLNSQQSSSLVQTVSNVLNELDARGISISEKTESDISDYANKFGVKEIENQTNARSRDDMTVSERHDEDNSGITEFQADEAYRKGKQRTDVEALRKAGESQAKGEKLQEGANFNRNIPVDKSDKTTWTVNGKEVEVSGWVTPAEVDEKALRQAEDAVKAKGQEADLKDRLSLLEARRTYLEKVAEQARKARADFYGSENIEQRKADLGYMADNIKEQLEQLDADMGYIGDELDNTLAEDPSSPQALSLAQALENAQGQSDRLKTQLDALRDEYRHLENGDFSTLKNVRNQIDNVTDEIRDLSRRLDGVSKRAARADWGSNKRTVFHGTSVSEQTQEVQKPSMRLEDRQRTEELDQKTGWPKSAVERAKALDKPFRSSFASYGSDLLSGVSFYVSKSSSNSDPLSGETYTAEQGQKEKSRSEQASLRDDLKNIIEGKGTLFQTVTVADQAPAHDDSDDPRRKLSKKEQRDQRKRVGNELATKPVSAEVAQGMLHLQEDVKGILDSNKPVVHVMNLANSISAFQNKNSEMSWLATKDISELADEIKSTFENRNMDESTKAQNMADATVRLLAAVSTRVNRAETFRAMALALESSAAQNGKRNGANAKGIKAASDYWKSMQLNPATIMKMIDGFDAGKGGDGYKLSRKISDSVAKAEMLKGDIHSRYAALKSEKGITDFAEGKSMSPVKLGNMELTEQQAIDFIKEVRTLQTQTVGSESRLDTIKGFAVKSKNGSTTHLDVGSLVATEDADGNKLTRKQISEGLVTLAQEMEKSLSPAAKQYLEITNGILFDLGKQVSSTKQRVTGLGFEDFNKGNYYPVKYVARGGSSNISEEDAGIFDAFSSRTRTTGGYVQVASCADTVDRYIDRAIYAASYGDLADTLSFLNSGALGTQGLSSAVADAFGRSFGRAVNNYVADVNNQSNKSMFDYSPLRAARLALQKGALRFSISVPIKQTASYWDAMGILSPESLMKAYRFKATKAKGYGAENNLLKARAVGSIDPTLSETLNNKGMLADLKKHSGIVRAMDMATSVMDYRTIDDLFHACVIEAETSFPDIDTNSKQFQDVVASLFQDVVLQSQPVFDKNARAEYQRTSNELIRALGMFRTQQTQNLNRMVTALGEYNAAKGTDMQKQSAKVLRQTIAGQVAASVEFGLLSVVADMARHKLKPYRKDDDDDTIDPTKILERVAKNSFASFAGTAWFGDQAAKFLMDAAAGDTSAKSGEFYGLNLGSISSAISAVNSISEDTGKVVNAIKTGDWSGVNPSNLRYDVTNMLQLFGVPANNVVNLFNSAAMYVLDLVDYRSGHTKGNRGVYDDAFKMLNDIWHDTYTEKTAAHQVDKFFKRGDTENMLWNLAIVESEGKRKAEAEGKKDPHKGHSYLNGLLTPNDQNEREAMKREEERIYGHELSGNEHIANYLVSSSMSSADVDKAVSEYANTGGYNVLYDALRTSGFSPSKAVNELYKSDSKNGMSTQIMSDDSVNSLLAGKAVDGPNNDIPPLEQRNLNEYTNFVSALKVFASTKNYSEFDKIIDGFSDLDQNTQDVLMAKASDVVPDGSLKYVLECAQLGISSKDYYDLKDTISDTQREMNKSSNTGTPLKLVALQNANLTDEQREALLDSDWMGISKTGHACLDVMRDYGMSIGEIGEFMNYAATVYGNMWGSGLTNVKAAAALEANTTLTDQQKAAVYEALKSQISSKYNDWGSYRYNTSTSRRYDNSELAYIHGPKFAGYLADYKAQHPEEFTDSDNDFDLLTDEEVEALRNES